MPPFLFGFMSGQHDTNSAEKIKSISRKIVENAKGIDPLVFDTKAARGRTSSPLFEEDTP